MIPSAGVRNRGTVLHPSVGRTNKASWATASLISWLSLLSCTGNPKAQDAGVTDDVARARAMISTATPLPSRPEAVALAQSVEALAMKEGAGARAVELHALAAA